MGNFDSAFNANPTAAVIPNLAGVLTVSSSPNTIPIQFALGIPFFFGRNVFTAIEGQTTPGGTGPYFAY